MDKIEIPLDDGHFWIDTPGIIHRHQMAHYLGKKDLRIIAPLKEIKPKVYQLNEGQNTFLGRALQDLILSAAIVLHLLLMCRMMLIFIEQNWKKQTNFIKNT